MRKLLSLLRFAGDSWRIFLSRARDNGFASALVFARSQAHSFYISVRNKHTKRPHVECPCCGWTGFDFYSQDYIRWWLPSVRCPNCGSRERHRMLQVYLTSHDPEFFRISGRVLHFAPEQHVHNIVRRNPGLRYIQADLSLGMLRNGSAPRFQCDIQHVPVKDNAVDIAFCLHVLEHVRHDRKAIAELHRVLKPGSIAYIMVPVDLNRDKTEEWDEPAPDVCDHIWAYALPDFKDKLGSFEYREIKPADFLSPEEIRRFRIPDKEIIYRCVKR